MHVLAHVAQTLVIENNGDVVGHPQECPDDVLGKESRVRFKSACPAINSLSIERCGTRSATQDKQASRKRN